ncbi:hypothetical protein ES703_59134 [subsurface metagenome]
MGKNAKKKVIMEYDRPRLIELRPSVPASGCQAGVPPCEDGSLPSVDKFAYGRSSSRTGPQQS